jgi:predicted TIM-barrel fold metal-dependent hydrolase
MPFRYYIGLGNLAWGSDFPHSVGTYPHSREILDDIFESVPAHERRQVLVENLCGFYGLDSNKEITPTPVEAVAI